MDFQRILFKKEAGVAALQLNRPRALNALDEAAIEEIQGGLLLASADPEVKVLLLTGSGRAFCFGAEVSEFQRARDSDRGGALENLLFRAQEMIRFLYEMPIPTIAVLNGFASGLGLDLALACDLRIAAERVKISEAFVSMGLIPDGGGTFLLPRLVGLARAAELIFTGAPITASEAERIGLINRVVPSSELEKTARELALTLARGPALALRLAKQALRKNLGGDLKTAHQVEAERQKLCFASADHQEAVRSFLEHRQPVFRGC